MPLKRRTKQEEGRSSSFCCLNRRLVITTEFVLKINNDDNNATIGSLNFRLRFFLDIFRAKRYRRSLSLKLSTSTLGVIGGPGGAPLKVTSSVEGLGTAPHPNLRGDSWGLSPRNSHWLPPMTPAYQPAVTGGKSICPFSVGEFR